MDYESLLGEEAKQLLTYVATGIPASSLIHPGPRVVDEVFASSDRTNRVLVELARLYGTGRLAGTGYVSILPVDQGVEHSAAASFAPNPTYFDPQRIVELAIEGALPLRRRWVRSGSCRGATPTAFRSSSS